MRICFLLLLLFAISCRKDRSCETCEGEPNPSPANQSVKAVIIDAGAQAADGCGWMVKIETKFYHPENLDASFEENNLPVVVSFQPQTDSFYCGLAPIGRPSIKLLSIRRQ